MDAWVPFALICLFIHLPSHSFSLRVIVLVFSSQSDSHDGQVINEFTGCWLAHQGRATDPENVYDPARGTESITNPNIAENLVQYAQAVRARHGDTYDPSTAPLDTDTLMRLGGGKQHGRYLIAHSVIDPASVPSLREVRKATPAGTSSAVPIQPRRASSTQMMASVQVTIRRSLLSHMLPKPYMHCLSIACGLLQAEMEEMRRQREADRVAAEEREAAMRAAHQQQLAEQRDAHQQVIAALQQQSQQQFAEFTKSFSSYLQSMEIPNYRPPPLQVSIPQPPPVVLPALPPLYPVRTPVSF